jgi:YceI-like domain
VFKSLGIGVIVLALAACGAPRPRHGAPQNPNEGAGRPELPHAGNSYPIDEGQSELRILVFRAGPLARLGHNHVMVNRTVRGAVSLADTPGASAFWLSVPAAGFVVDDAQARAEEGAEFAAAVPDEARSGTLQNMLGSAVLDAAEFPSITVKSLRITAAPDAANSGSLVAAVSVGIAGHESTIDVPFTLQSDPRRLSATGSMELRQTDLGLAPYSLMLGALQVQDAMTIKFKIVAQLPEDSSSGVPSGATRTAAGTCRSGDGNSPADEMPTSVSRARVPPTSSTSNRNVARRKCAGSYSPRST